MHQKRDTVEIRVEVVQDDEYGTVYVASNGQLLPAKAGSLSLALRR